MKIYQKKYLFFFKRGGRAPDAPVLDPPLGCIEHKDFNHLYFHNSKMRVVYLCILFFIYKVIVYGKTEVPVKNK